MITVKRYTPENHQTWNEFVKQSRQGTFLFDRNYMDYHQDRFHDHSLMIYYKDKLYALLPANEVVSDSGNKVGSDSDIEISLKEVDSGVIEAALATGAKTSLIIRKVLLVEAAPGIARGITVTFISLIGFSAMAGMVGGGGIGNLAVQYGYYRYETGIMIFTIVVLVFIVQLAQYIGDYVAKKLTH